MITEKTGNVTWSGETTEVVSGLTAWKNVKNGFTVALLHFKADPEGATEAERRSGMTEEQYLREHDLDWSSWAGKPVYTNFTDKCVDEGVFPSPNIPLYRSWDFGYHRPAVSWVQAHSGFWVVGEAMGEDMTLNEFINTVALPYHETLIRSMPEDKKVKVIDVADPAGKQVTDKSEHTSFSILANHGIFPMARRSEINEGLTLLRQSIQEGGFKVHPRCRIIIEGMKGGYRYPEPTKGRPEPLFPLKDGYYDHLQDTLRYAAIHALSLRIPRKKEKRREASIVDRVLAARSARQVDNDLGIYG